MRKLLLPLLLLGVVLVSACGNPTGSERRSLMGLWESTGPGGASVRMTLTEVARTVEGAGTWVESDRAMAFRISGAHAGETVSLLFQIEDTDDINFLGGFSGEDTLEGTLTGGRLRAQAATFTRVKER